MKTSFNNNSHSIYLPAVNDSYASVISKPFPQDRPFPKGLNLRDLAFWESDALWHYPFLLHSIGLYSVGTHPNNAVTQRNPNNNVLVGDSGGFQIGKGTLKGLSHIRPKLMTAQKAVNAWQCEVDTRRWIVGWLDAHAQYAMTLDMPLWATSSDGNNSPFHNCSTQQLIDMTVNNLKFIEWYTTDRAKWLNVIQGGEDTSQILVWWNAVKWFRRGGWAMAGSAGAKGGLANMLSTLLTMRDDGAFDTGQDWLHVLGVSTPMWAVFLTSIQQALQTINPALRVSYDSSSPFHHGGKYEKVALTPAYSSEKRTWSIGVEAAPQSRRYADPALCIPFAHSQSPLGKRLQLHHLSVRAGIWDQRHFDSISNVLLINHNVWVYLDAFNTANLLAATRNEARVPRQYIQCMDFISEIFKSNAWAGLLSRNKALLDAVAPSGYKAWSDGS